MAFSRPDALDFSGLQLPWLSLGQPPIVGSPMVEVFIYLGAVPGVQRATSVLGGPATPGQPHSGGGIHLSGVM